jgi:hypothetical protein
MSSPERLSGIRGRAMLGLWPNGAERASP